MKHQGSDNVEKKSFCQRVVEAACARPDKVAMTMLGPAGVEEMTFGSVVGQIRSVAYCLSREHVNFGDRVAIIGENHPNWAVAYLGILYRGAVVTPLDPAATTETLASFLGDSEAKLAFVSPASLNKFRAACEQLGSDIPAVALRPLPIQDGSACFDEWAGTPAPPEFDSPVPTGDDDLALLMYTSGTTGRPKAVPLTHGNIYAQSDKAAEVMRVSDREVVLSLLPLFHAYSQIVNLWLATIIGARVVYVAELSSTDIERGLKEGGATALLGVPRLWYLFHKKIFDAVGAKPAPVRWIFKALLAANGALRDSLHLNAGHLFFGPVHKAFGGRLRLAVSAGAIFDESVAGDFHRLGFTILQGYGMTETSGAVTVTRFEDNAVGSVGTPLNGVEVRVNEPDEQGVGEILIRGPIVMPGYYRNPEANCEAFTADGWFRSGDLGRFDGRGHLYIVGRKKDVIKLPSGKNVFPEDVEAHYERSPAVSEICVLGVRDEASGFKGAEKLCAVVVPDFDHLKARQITNATEWVRWELESLGRELPEYQRVHELIFRAEPLPRTTTRKLRRFELKDELEASAGRRTHKRMSGEVPLGGSELELMNSPAGRAAEAAIRRQVSDVSAIHPRMNLEIDLRLDSLARAESLTYVEQALGIEFAPEDAAAAHTVGELILMAGAKTRAGGASGLGRADASDTAAQQAASEHACDADESHWHKVLAGTRTDVPELRSLLKRKRVTEMLARTVLWLTYVGSRLLFRMEVRGGDVLKRLKPPYLICPNHQSYIDPFLVCSTYPRGMLARVVHVGSSRYFKGFVMSRLARLINVLPVDPDVHLLRAMRAGAAALREGKILNIYPEAHRSFDGRLQEFKKGAAILATELNVPVVPVALDGTHRIWPRESWRIRAAKIRISFGEPIDVRTAAPGETDEEVIYARVTALLEERIRRMLDEARALSVEDNAGVAGG
jgi:long-chain acyl-CoA synthetase